jgi:hypothetical protein
MNKSLKSNLSHTFTSGQNCFFDNYLQWTESQNIPCKFSIKKLT